jgi:hypothetical protein
VYAFHFTLLRSAAPAVASALLLFVLGLPRRVAVAALLVWQPAVFVVASISFQWSRSELDSPPGCLL